VARRYFPHIYFESKKPGKDSVYEAVDDIGRPGVNSPREVKLLVAATVADLADGYTVDHYGRRVRYTRQKLLGRFLVLQRLAKRHGGGWAVDYGRQVALNALKIKDKRLRKQYIKEHLQKLGLAPETIERLIARTNRAPRTTTRTKKTRTRKRRRRKR
jgi:hypothetical protein